MPSADPSRALLDDAIRAQTSAALGERGGWRTSIDTAFCVGHLDIDAIDALSPFEGVSVIVTDVGTPAAAGSALLGIGDLAEYQGSVTGWQIVTTNVNGVPPDGTRVILAYATIPLQAPFVVGADEGKVAIYGGAGMTPSSYLVPDDGDTVTCNGGASNNSYSNQRKFAFEGTVPTGEWEDTGGLKGSDIGWGLLRAATTNVLSADRDTIATAFAGTALVVSGAVGAKVLDVDLGTGAAQAAAGNDVRIPLAPVSLFMYTGNATVATLNGLSPIKGEAYVCTGATATPTAGSSDELSEGDGCEFDGTDWKKIWSNVGGYPPAGTRALVTAFIFRTLLAPLATPADSSKVAQWGGASLTPTRTAATAGQSVNVISGEGLGVLMLVTIAGAGDVWFPPLRFGSAMDDESAVYFATPSVDDSTIAVHGSGDLVVKDLGITAGKVAAANKDGAVGVASMRTLGTGALQAAAGDHSHGGVDPVTTIWYAGTRTVAQINALVLGTTLWPGLTVVSSDADTPTEGSSDALVAGSVAQFDGTSWIEIFAGAGGFVPAGTRLIVAQVGASSWAPVSAAGDRCKIAVFDGASNTPTLTAAAEGDEVWVYGGSVHDPQWYVLDGAAPTWEWRSISPMIWNTNRDDLIIPADVFSSWGEVASIATPLLPAGDYLIEWSAVLRCVDDAYHAYVRVQVDDTTPLVGEENMFFETPNGSNATLRMPVAGSDVFTLAAGPHLIDMDVAREHTDGHVYVYAAALAITRVKP